MATVEIDSHGTKRYYNDKGDFHREDGPAIINLAGRIRFMKNGKPHCFDGNPSVIDRDGTRSWQVGLIHSRKDGPSLVRPNGYKSWSEGIFIKWPTLL